MTRGENLQGHPRRWTWRSPVFAGAALTAAGIFAYDITTYFYLGAALTLISMLMLFAGLALLLAAALRWIWGAAAGKLATVGLVLALGFVMGTLAPTVFAPPAMQGGENEMFRRTPIALAVAGGLLLIAAGARYLAERRHSRR
jgi:hypothetical protein